MALVISNWGDGYNMMSWLDKDTGCRGDCRNNPTVNIDNIEYKVGNPGSYQE